MDFFFGVLAGIAATGLCWWAVTLDRVRQLTDCLFDEQAKKHELQRRLHEIAKLAKD